MDWNWESEEDLGWEEGEWELDDFDWEDWNQYWEAWDWQETLSLPGEWENFVQEDIMGRYFVLVLVDFDGHDVGEIMYDWVVLVL